MAPKDLNYNVTRRETLIDLSEFYQQTVTCLEQIKAHIKENTGNCLKGKVCIVTGAESLKGIGMQPQGTFLYIQVLNTFMCWTNRPQNLPNLQSTVQSKYPGVKITCIAGDATDEAAIKALCTRVLVEEGRLNVFFANAGVATATRLQDADPDVFMRTMRINTLSCMLAIKHASVAMMKTNLGKTLSGGVRGTPALPAFPASALAPASIPAIPPAFRPSVLVGMCYATRPVIIVDTSGYVLLGSY
ncbi:hypothetical protein B0H14DRAFT_2342850 [Mycena olivaceomarginata]|nr:hypothetical protein B0H14DRAFT_2342850 [Mycena olivaceomarginata]